MGIFATIRRALRKGGALPNEHGPAVIVRNAKGNWVEDPKELKQSKCGDNCNCEPKQAMSVTITKVKATTDAKPATIPAVKLSAAEENTAVAKPKPKPTKLEQVKTDAARMAAKQLAILKDLDDEPIAKVKPVSKKTVPSTEVKKAPAKKVTRPVAKEAPKAQPKPAAKKPAPKKK